jgi:hypothetical protein
MSSWVAPSVAAEIWGISIEQVLTGIANGSVKSYIDGQFLFVDLEGHGYSKPPRSPTAEIVTEQELAALTFQPAKKASPSAIDHQPEISPDEEERLRDAEDADPAPDGPLCMPEEDFRDVTLWRTARQQSARLRRPPSALAA